MYIYIVKWLPEHTLYRSYNAHYLYVCVYIYISVYICMSMVKTRCTFLVIKYSIVHCGHLAICQLHGAFPFINWIIRTLWSITSHSSYCSSTRSHNYIFCFNHFNILDAMYTWDRTESPCYKVNISMIFGHSLNFSIH